MSVTEQDIFIALKPKLRGRLVTPADTDYNAVRTIYNAMIDRRPAAIARCVDIADVIASVNPPPAMRECRSRSARGHNGPGLSLVDDGLVIDLS
ncbi:MAG: hypothetical protein U0521_12570 [Anaerolineae bacterium]